MALTKLALKYRESWVESSDALRKALCERLGLSYTNVRDHALLNEVAKRQQGEYDGIRESMEAGGVSTPEDVKWSIFRKSDKADF